MYKKKNSGLQLVVLLAFGGFMQPTFAYLDPSTGSMVLSAVVGIFATLGLALKTYWYKMKSRFVGAKSVKESPESLGQGQED